MQVTTTQVRKWFHNLNISGDKYRADIAHSAIRMLQANRYQDAVKTLSSIGYPFAKHTPSKLRPRLDSIYSVSAQDAKTYNAEHVSQIAGFRAVVYGQSNWRMETIGSKGKIVSGKFVRAIDADKLARPDTKLKPRKMLVSIETVITRARHLIETAPYARNSQRQLTRARKMLDFAATVLPMQAAARVRFADTLAAMTRMEAAIQWKRTVTRQMVAPYPQRSI